MSRRTAPAPPESPDGGANEPRGAASSSTASAAPASERAPAADLGTLSIAGLTRHRVLLLTVLLAGAWLVFAFVREVGDVTAASGRADALASANAQLRGEVSALEAELRLIQRQDYVVQQARAYGLGAAREVPFSLQQPVPSLAPDAPGSAGTRVGSTPDHRTPLEGWLIVLFGEASAAAR